jgi:hypothetical protein
MTAYGAKRDITRTSAGGNSRTLARHPTGANPGNTLLVFHPIIDKPADVLLFQAKGLVSAKAVFQQNGRHSGAHY